MIKAGDTVWVVLRPRETVSPEDGNLVQGRVCEVIRTIREATSGEETEIKYDIDIGLQNTVKPQALVYGLEDRSNAVTAAKALIIEREESLIAAMEDTKMLRKALPSDR